MSVSESRNPPRKDGKPSVFLCTGCGIGQSVDPKALEAVTREGRATTRCLSHPFLCGEEGRTILREELKGGAPSLVVGACSARFHAADFAFEGCHTERVNLRELVAWSHEPAHEDTQMLAEDYLRMGIARAQRVRAPEPQKLEICERILVVGGGFTGLHAALAAARAGHEVVLVEKEAELGGHLREFSRVFPMEAPHRELQENPLEALLAELHSEARVRVISNACLERIDGQPGQFDVTLRVGASKECFRVGSIVQATGWRPYEASRLTQLGHGRCADVITNLEMERALASGSLLRPSGGPARRVLFVQCAGSRDEQHLAQCSAVCCRVSLKQALQVRKAHPESECVILYKDLRALGHHEDFYRRVQEDPGIFFAKGEVISIGQEQGALVRVRAENTLLGEDVEFEADLVVLATGMVPRAADGEALRQLEDARAIIARGEAGAQLDLARATQSRLEEIEGTDLLHLSYRQGPDLPTLKQGFPDSHFICFPYESRRTGIYAAGCVRAPNDLSGCRDDAMGAALKAIQCVKLASRGEAMHPRWADVSSPDFHMQRCTQCKRCTEECPFGTLDEDEKGTPRPNPTRCRRCGICLGACPERIISFADYSPDIISSMIKAVEIPDEFEEKPRILVFLCENDALPALDAAGLARIPHSAFVRVIPVRCLGSVNVVWIADALARGFDGILLVGCKSGEDYQCHFIRGSELMGTRSENIKQKLTQLALEEERVQLEQVSIAEYARLPALIDAFVARIIALGMNPFKG